MCICVHCSFLNCHIVRCAVICFISQVSDGDRLQFTSLKCTLALQFVRCNFCVVNVVVYRRSCYDFSSKIND